MSETRKRVELRMRLVGYHHHIKPYHLYSNLGMRRLMIADVWSYVLWRWFFVLPVYYSVCSCCLFTRFTLRFEQLAFSSSSLHSGKGRPSICFLSQREESELSASNTGSAVALKLFSNLSLSLSREDTSPRFPFLYWAEEHRTVQIELYGR